MVMKRRQGVFVPLFCALLVTLVLGMMPHHHHGETLCLAAASCVTQHEDHGEQCRHHDHSHACGEGCELHLFQQTEVIHESSWVCGEEVPVCTLAAFLMSPDVLGEDGMPAGRRVILLPYRERLHTCWKRGTLAGRAPPVSA